MALKPAVDTAIGELQKTFRSSNVTWKEDPDGGAIITMEEVPLNAAVFLQSETWLGFHITFQYPIADVYPHHLRPDLARKDGRQLVGPGLHANRNFQGRTSLMLSRSTTRRGARADTAARKLKRVLTWLERCRAQTST